MSLNDNSIGDEMELTLISNRSHIWVSYESMFKEQSLTDVVINCRDGQIRAHKLVLSAWSQYFKDIFVSNTHQLCHMSYIFMKDIPFSDLKLLIELMYCGRASLSRTQLDSIEKSAKALSIKDFTQLLIQLDDNKNVINTTGNKSLNFDYNHRKRKRKRDNDINEEENDVSMDENECHESEDKCEKQSENSERVLSFGDNNSLNGRQTHSSKANLENNQILKQSIIKKSKDVESDQISLLCKESICDSFPDFKNNIQSKDETKSCVKETIVSKNVKQIELNRESDKETNGSQTQKIKIIINDKISHSPADDNNNKNQKMNVRIDKRKSMPTKILYTNRDLSEKHMNSTTQSKNKTSDDSENYTFSRCLRSSTQQTSRFAQLSYEERQHHFKLQQMSYQSPNETKSSETSPQTKPNIDALNNDDEKLSSTSDMTSDSEKLLVQLNPSDVLCDSEDSDVDYQLNNQLNKVSKSQNASQVIPIEEEVKVSPVPVNANPINEDVNYLHLTPPALTTRVLINNASVSGVKPNTGAEPLYVYNLVSNPMSFRPTSISVPTAPTLMYISDPKVTQKRDSNISSTEKKIVPHWTSSGKTTNIAPKSSHLKITPNASPSTTSITLLSNPDTSPQKKKVVPQNQSQGKTIIAQTSVTKTPSNRKKRNSYQCNKCTKAYSSHQTLVDHFKIVHQNSTENYACKICGKAVKWKDSLRSHFKTNHPDVDSTNMIQIL